MSQPLPASPGTSQLGARPSPNIWQHPQIYEIENEALDPDRIIESTMRAIRDWSGSVVLDLGCGAGFHLPGWAADARQVIGLEPHPPLAAAAAHRLRRAGVGGAAVVRGLAQALPLADASIDVVHARWAYFFGPGCEPGLAELARVLRPGGTAFVIDHDASRSTFGQWFRREWPAYDPTAIERFWRRHGWSRRSLMLNWGTRTRADFEAVVGIEFTESSARRIIAEHPGHRVDHAINLWWRRF